ncbi:hypothetical protein J4430_00210 [Candidatus Woesearchaeota archaeon]|nr:hypothetical protein [Candidatus Woesearchaeota archaeon]
MQIIIDTEKESVDNLKRIAQIVEEAIIQKGGKVQPQEQRQQAQEKPPIPAGGKTAGGARVIPYKDMSNKMSEIFSNLETRRR